MHLVYTAATQILLLVTSVSFHFRPPDPCHPQSMTHDWLDSDELYAVNLFPDLSLTEGDGGCQSLLVSLGSSQSIRLSTSSLEGGRRWTRTLLQLILFFFTFSQVYFKTLSQLWWLGGEIGTRSQSD